MKNKNKEWQALALVFLTLCIGDSGVESCQWSQHLASCGRTGYTSCDGPDSPEILWKISLPGEVDTPPLVVNDTVLLLVKDSCAHLSQSSLVVLDLFTGDTIGGFEGEEWYPYIDMFTDGTSAYLIGEDKYLSDKDGLWRVTLAGGITPVATVPRKHLSFPSCHAIILEDAIIYPTTPLICFSKRDFSVLWSTESIPECKGLVIRSAAADESHVFVLTEGDNSSKIWALSIGTGDVEWAQELPGTFSQIAVETSTIFVGGERVCAFKVSTGELVWEFSPRGKVYTNLVIGQENIFVTDSEKQLYALNKITGNMTWATQHEPDTGWRFLVGGGAFLYIVCGEGDEARVVCFHAENGAKTWEYKFMSPVLAGPALSQGILVVALRMGEVYAFSHPNVIQQEAEKSSEYTERGPLFSHSSRLSNLLVSLASTPERLNFLLSERAAFAWNFAYSRIFPFFLDFKYPVVI